LPKLVIAKESKLRRFEGVSEAGAFSRNPEPKAKDLNKNNFGDFWQYWQFWQSDKI